MGLQLRIHAVQRGLQYFADLLPARLVAQRETRLLRQVDQGERLRQPHPGHAGRLDGRMAHQPGFDGRRRDVLALGGLEHFLDPAGDA
ncbi:hypothetical protein D3C72_2129900 [compost metagenome]